MKNLIYIFIIFSAVTVSAQVGISTTGNYTPATGIGLGVDGSLTVRNKIYVGGTDATLGNPGKRGQVLVSQGANLPPRWRTLNIPNFEAGLFYLIYNNAFTDYTNNSINDEGISLGSSVAGNNGPYELGVTRASLGTAFTSINGLTEPFQVYSNNNQAYITFEAVAQITSTEQEHGVDLVCGIFAGGNSNATRTLRGLRRISLFQDGAATHTFITFTQIALADGLTIGTHTAEVACKRVQNHNNFTGNLGIGRSSTGTENLSNFITKTSLKVEVYEIPQVFGDIVQ